MEGAKVRARFGATKHGASGTSWFDGTVTAVHSTGQCDIKFDDGDFEANVLPKYVKLIINDAGETQDVSPLALRCGAFGCALPLHHMGHCEIADLGARKRKVRQSSPLTTADVSESRAASSAARKPKTPKVSKQPASGNGATVTVAPASRAAAEPDTAGIKSASKAASKSPSAAASSPAAAAAAPASRKLKPTGIKSASKAASKSPSAAASTLAAEVETAAAAPARRKLKPAGIKSVSKAANKSPSAAASETSALAASSAASEQELPVAEAADQPGWFRISREHALRCMGKTSLEPGTRFRAMLPICHHRFVLRWPADSGATFRFCVNSCSRCEAEKRKELT